ncbi:MAG: elongation factor G [Beijerinckiaceae bacterium]
MTGSSPGANTARHRSVALVGPYGSGKSTLFEALLASAGAPLKRPTDPRNRTMSTEIRLGHCTYLGDDWSILDCPGSIEFAYETLAALTIVDCAVVVCEPSPERMSSLTLLLRTLEERQIPHLVFINKVDTMTELVRESIAAMQTYSKFPIILRQIPIREGDAITGYVDVVNERAYKFRTGQPSERIALPVEMRDREKEAFAGLAEVLADHDDAILEKILEDVTPTSEEIFRQLHKDQETGAIVQVLLGASGRKYGITRLWKALRHDVAEVEATAARHGIAQSDQPLVQIFKTTNAGQAAYTGKLSFGRIWRGTLQDGSTLNGSRIGGIYRFVGGEPSRVASAEAGDVVAIGRLEGVATGAVLGGESEAEKLAFPPPPPPVYSLAIAAKDRKDDVKLSAALRKLVEEDPSLSVVQDQAIGETLLHGQGDIHLNIAIERLASHYNLQINTSTPRVAFKETIRHACHEHARLKRQTGGHGQFADIKLDIEPRGRGEGFLFVDKIVGGAVPRQYIPAVREASEEAMQKGPFGYPVVDVAVTLVDGGFHSVDSSDMAFRTATRIGIAEGLAKAGPVLLEPIDHVTVSVPNQFTAGVQRLLSGRRGQILGYAERPGWPGWDDVQALVPEAELHDLILQLRSDTSGLGSYRHSFDHLAEAHVKLAEKVGHLHQ